jgi:hypothetical protein
MTKGRDGRPAGARSDGLRPGPDALYGDHPTPPQLEHGPGWEADPLLVSGAETDSPVTLVPKGSFGVRVLGISDGGTVAVELEEGA